MIKKIFLFVLLTLFYAKADYNDLINIYKSDFDSLDDSNTLSEIQKNREFALSSYIALKMASYFYYQNNLEKAEKFLNLIDSKALLKDDYPFYLYINGKIKNNNESLKNLAINYCYTYYGYKAYLEMMEFLSVEEKEKSVENCIKNKHYEKAKYLLSTIEDENTINYFLVKISKEKDQKINYFLNIQPSSQYYEKALSIIANLNQEYEKIYLDYLLQKNKVDKYLEFLTKRAKKSFYSQNYDEFLFYTELIESYEELPPDLVWLKFLYFYKTKDKELAKYYLNRYKQHSKDLYQILYWQSLLENGELTIPKEKLKPEDISPYLALIYYKNKINPDLEKTKKCSMPADNVAITIKNLKNQEYKLAYIEGNYYIKSKPCERLYSIMAEVAVKCFGQNSQCSYVKPFLRLQDKEMENIVYAIIKQESFFDPYAISWSNAVGLTQFIPKTAKWTAENLKVEGFDMTDLFNPDLSVKFSVWYLSRLINMFNGELVYVFASYNSGENAVKKFLDKNKPQDLAEFIEFYPYDETRDYVKKVLRNYIIYKSIGE
ncbi:lytic transglycosylase domain-containing protein [Sulfurihydrogenibium sp.]|uniref:lytic transglycosylase domain-containing protein n=1 Tax=Sulfurihydrogenibium sp. TaxID=2053621 RepID=UPI00262B32D7|nr:lytic transglycosylase domain-containing protein [Sulfurihydrogenibium sp.]